MALTAALLFGISTPLVQKFGSGVGAFATAALLYAGAAIAGALLRQRVEREARVARGDFSRLLAMAAAGAVIGPVALAWGLQRTSGTSASLMLTLEALFTAVLAWRLYRETMNRRVWAAMLLLLAGGILLVLDQWRDGGARLWVQDFAHCAHPVSSDWTHVAWVTGGAAEKEFYASLLREASFLALTPR